MKPFRLALSTSFFTQSPARAARRFHPWDFRASTTACCCLYLAGITAFGTRFRRAQHTVADYFIGARNIRWWVISLSIVATETSTLTLVGVPAIAFATFARPEQGGNLTYLQVVVGYIVARVLHQLAVHPRVLRRATAHGLRAAQPPLRRGGQARHGLAVSHHAAARGGRARVRRVARAERGDLARACRPCRTSGSGRFCSSAASRSSTRSRAASPP